MAAAMSIQMRRVIVLLCLGGLVMATAYLFADIFTSGLVIFAGVLFGIFLNGTSKQVARVLSLKYAPAFALVVTLLLVIVFATSLLLGSRIAASVDQFMQEYHNAQNQLLQRIDRSNWWKQAVDSMQQKQTSEMSIKAVSAVTSTATVAASVVVKTCSCILLDVILGFYFALQPHVYRQGILALFTGPTRQAMEETLDHLGETLWSWILGRLAGMVVIGVSSAVGLWLIGVPLPITLGVLAGLLTFVPNLGPLLSVVPPLLFSLQLGGFSWLYVLALYTALQFFESYFLTPAITQHQVGLPPGLTLSSQLLFGMLSGFLGLLLATPLTVVIQILFTDLYLKEPGNANELLKWTPKPGPANEV